MWMTDYIREIQSQLISRYGFEKGENGCPQNVPDGAYPMMIDKELDMVQIVDGKISCLNLAGSKKGLKEYQKKVAVKNK